mmetsp:Transcript_12660/g.42273  ORF Transcript_12660/g.42273 Transcript_12660/m.42273 type:complete len:94 (+) Transcript_12660:58-339(+)
MFAHQLAARAVPVVRGQRRTFLVKWVVNLPNRVQEYRQPFIANPHLHGAENPTYLKGPNDTANFLLGCFLCTSITIQFTVGVYNMALGINKTR